MARYVGGVKDVLFAMTQSLIIYPTSLKLVASDHLIPNSRALQLSEKDFPDLHHSGLTNLARLLTKQKKFGESQTLFRQALKIAIEKYGPESEEASTTMHCFAFYYEAREIYGMAESLRRNAVACKTHVKKKYDHGTKMKLLANTLETRGKYAEALPFYRETLSLHLELLGPGHPVTLDTRNFLVQCLIANSEYMEAEEVVRETLRLKTGFEDKISLDARDLLARTLIELNRTDEAELEYRESVKLRIKTVGLEDNDTLMTRHSLAILLVKNEKFGEAEELCKENISIWSRTVGPDDFRTRSASDQLTECMALRFRKSGRFDEAFDLYEKKIRLEISLKHGDPMAVIWSLTAMALEMQECGRSEQAQNLLRRFITLCTETVGAANLTTIQVTACLARVLDLDGRLEEAETIYHQLVKLETQLLTDNYRSFDIDPISREKLDIRSAIDDMNNYARILAKNGKHADAEHSLRKTIALSTKVRGSDDDYTLNTKRHLVTLFRGLKRLNEAESLLQEVLSTRTQFLGSNHEDSLETMVDMGNLYCDLERYSEAETIYQGVLRIRTQIVGSDLQDTLQDMWSLGQILLHQKRFEEAEKLFRDVLAVEIRTLGADHENTLSTMGGLGRKLTIMKRYDEAQSIQRDALARCIKTLGHGHATTLKNMFELGETLLHLGEQDEAEKLLYEAFVLHVQAFGPADKGTLQVKERLENGLKKSTPDTTLTAPEPSSAADTPMEKMAELVQDGELERRAAEPGLSRKTAE